MGYKIEDLQEKVGELIQESRDRQFTTYLKQVAQKLNDVEKEVTDIGMDIEKNNHIYLQRLQMAKQNIVTNPTKISEESHHNIETKVSEEINNSDINVIQEESNSLQVEAVKIQTVEDNSISSNKRKETNSLEFTIGAWVLSIIGAIFIVISFGILGTNYMDGLGKGLLLYAISGIVTVISEVIFRKKMRRLSFAVTAIGVVGLFISTIINYSVLHNFNEVVAIIIIIITSILTLIISRKKQSATFEIISFIGIHQCLYPILNDFSNIHFGMIIAIVAFIQLIIIIAPVHKLKYQINMIHMITNVLVTFIIVLNGVFYYIEYSSIAFFLTTAVIIQNILFIRQHQVVKKRMQQEVQVRGHAGNIITYLLTNCILLFLLVLNLSSISNDLQNIKYLATLIIATIMGLTFLILFRTKEKWIQYYLFIAFILCVFGFNKDEIIAYNIAIIGSFMLSKILARISYLKVSELLITLFITSIITFDTIFGAKDNNYLILTACMVISILFLYHWKSLYQCLIVYTIGISILTCLETSIGIPILVVVILLAMVLFYHISFLRGKSNVVYNRLSVGTVALLYFLFPWQTYNNLTYFCMIIFGLTFIILMMQEKYGLNIAKKAMLISLFLTYMAFFLKTDMRFMVSISLVIVAIGSVCAGFIIGQKSERLYGIVLVLIVCLKVILWDFVGIQTLQKVILLFVVGIIVLTISGIYIMLEKKVQ